MASLGGLLLHPAARVVLLLPAALDAHRGVARAPEKRTQVGGPQYAVHAPLANADPDEPPTFELLTLVAEWLDTREFVSFAAVSKECRVAAHWQLHAALLAALRLSLVQQDAAIRNSAAVGFTGLVWEGSPRGAAFIQIAPALITTTHMWSGERGADDVNIAVLALVAMVAMLDGVLMVELVLKCGFLTAALSVTCSLTAVTVAMVATVAAMELETSKKIKIVCTVFTHKHRLKMIRTELQRRIVCLETWQFAPFCEVCRTLEAAADIQRVRRWRSIAARRRCQRR